MARPHSKQSGIWPENEFKMVNQYQNEVIDKNSK
jgi:hypothetical protein